MWEFLAVNVMQDLDAATDISGLNLRFDKQMLLNYS